MIGILLVASRRKFIPHYSFLQQQRLRCRLLTYSLKCKCAVPSVAFTRVSVDETLSSSFAVIPQQKNSLIVVMTTTTDIEDLFKSLEASSVIGDHVARPFISVSAFAEHFSHNCDLFLKSSISEKFVDAQREVTPPKKNPDNLDAFARRGLEWEKELYANKGVTPIDPDKPLLETRRCLINAAKDKSTKWIAQPSFFCETPLFAGQIYFSRFYIDLLEVVDLKAIDQSTTITFKVIDAKSTSKVHLSHRVQVTLYILLLRDIFNDWNAGPLAEQKIKFEVSNEGGVWLINNKEPTPLFVEQLAGGVEHFLKNEALTIWQAEKVQSILHEHDCNNCFKRQNCLDNARDTRSVNLIHGLSKVQKAELLKKCDTIDGVLKHVDSTDAIFHHIQTTIEAIQSTKMRFFRNVISSYLDSQHSDFIALGFDSQDNLGACFIFRGKANFALLREDKLVPYLHKIVQTKECTRTQIVMNSKYEYKLLESILRRKALANDNSDDALQAWQLLCALFLSPQIVSLDAVPANVMNNNVIVLPDVLEEVAVLPKLSPFWNIEDWLIALELAAENCEDKLRASTINMLAVITALQKNIPKASLRQGVVEPMKFPQPSAISYPLNKLYFMESIEASYELNVARKMRAEKPVSGTNEWLMVLKFNLFSDEYVGDTNKKSRVGYFTCLSRNSNLLLKEGPQYLLSTQQEQLWNFSDTKFKVNDRRTYPVGCITAKWKDGHGELVADQKKFLNDDDLIALGSIPKSGTDGWQQGTIFYCTKVVYTGNLEKLKQISNSEKKVDFVWKPSLNYTTWMHQSNYLKHKVNLLWGPPGSGKTFACCNLLENIGNNQKATPVVYVTAFTKQAIRNIIKSMNDRLDDQEHMIWLGKQDDNSIEIASAKVPKKLEKWLKINNCSRIVFGTTWQFANYQSKLPKCDVLIIDEGSQMPVMHALLPMLSMNDDAKVLVIGDYKQLPPVRKEEYPSLNNLEKSILLYWWNHEKMEDHKSMLMKNWRMNHKLCDQLQALYPGYQSDTSVAKQTLQRKPGVALDHLNAEQATIVSCDIDNASIVIITNCEDPMREAHLLYNIGLLIHGSTQKTGDSADPFAIAIVPHHTQRRRLEALGFGDNQMIGTVHSFQGVSCDVALISLGFLTKQQVIQEWEFLNLELINVATTRAKMKNILILSDKLLQPPIHDNPRVSDAYLHLQTIIDNSTVFHIDEKHILMQMDNN